MCDYQELMIWHDRADRFHMPSEQLKSMIEAGRYKPDPALVAEAMLSRRGVRELLTSSQPLRRDDRTRTASVTTRRAA
jgi:hypothetical protein